MKRNDANHDAFHLSPVNVKRRIVSSIMVALQLLWYWPVIYVVSQILRTVDASYSVDDYINVLGVYSMYRHISHWTHFTCYRNGEISLWLYCSKKIKILKFVQLFLEENPNPKQIWISFYRSKYRDRTTFVGTVQYSITICWPT